MRQESEKEIEYMDLGELDLEGIEKSCIEKGKGYVPQEQVSLLKESILKEISSNTLGTSSGAHKETKNKYEENGRKISRKTNK